MSDTLGRRALNGAGSTFLWQALRLMLLAVSIVVLARLLSPADYGLLAMVTALIGIGELFRDLGLSMAAVQAKNLTTDEKTNLFWTNSAIGLVLTVVVFVLAWPIAGFYGEPRLIYIAQVLSVTFLLNGVATQFKAQMTRDLRFMALGISETVPQAIGLGLAIVLAVWLGDYRALVFQALAVAVIALGMDLVMARWWPGLPKRHVSIRKYLKFGGALAGTQGIAYVSKNIDNVALGYVFGVVPLGLYNRAYQLVVLPLTQLTAPLSRVAIPVLSKLQDDDQQFMKYLRSGQFFGVLVSSVFYGAIVGLAQPFVEVVLGPSWLPTVPILQALAISGVFRVMGQVPYWIFVAKGLVGSQLRFYLVAQPVVVLAILAGLPWGPIGVAIGCSVGYAVFWFAQMWWAGRKASLRTGPLIASGISLAAIVAIPIAAMSLGISLALGDNYLAVALLSALAIAVYVALIVVAIPPYRQHASTVLAILRRRRR